ncbi:hypothetical protein AVEN_47019-1 [Araneus ventricosus]|uniref:Transposase Tc1-like domain-containing protein n=1 Tax=Araneus ventricosus TaxID=182803 RepID=A0A4Y2ISU2_ARAVE|nr:hypothetical protein AVEN_47019-1 [Araneus ventricosus]
MMDSSRSAQRAGIQFLRAEGGHASQIYRRMKEAYGEVHGARYFGRVSVRRRNNVTNSATISAVDELIRQNCRFTTLEIAAELSISKGTVHHIIHKKLGYSKVSAQWVPK